VGRSVPVYEGSLDRIVGVLAVVIDEFGGTAGVITVDDLLAALVGPMREETTEGMEPPTPAIARHPDGSLVADGRLRLDEWEEGTGVRLDEADHAAVNTIGGMVMARLGRIPRAGDEVAVGSRVLRVEALDGMRVAAGRLLPPAPELANRDRVAP
jgi:CBS domain containing-hemolysin-like protein